MATESFSKTFIVDDNSADCINKILKSENPIIIKPGKRYIRISKPEIKKIFMKNH